MADKSKDQAGVVPEKLRSAIVPQTDFPAWSLEKAQSVAQAIIDNFGGRSANPNQVAIAIDLSPTSSSWRMLSGAAVAYGLTDGGYNAKEIKLTDRGRAIVAPTEEGQSAAALQAALVAPTVMRKFVERYDNQKFPSRTIGINVLESIGLPRERCGTAFDLLEENLKFVGALQQTKTGHMVMVDMIGGGAKTVPVPAAPTPDVEPPELPSSLDLSGSTTNLAPKQPERIGARPGNINVFISHGKNQELVETIERAVRFARLNPIVSVKITDVAKPVPEKIIEEMESCFGGIVHVRGEGEWKDADGNVFPKINDNVLIEIGAAMTLYKNNFILLVETGTKLPSNLQGLYICYYEGSKLDGESTMKLLEGLSKFKPPI